MGSRKGIICPLFLSTFLGFLALSLSHICCTLLSQDTREDGPGKNGSPVFRVSSILIRRSPLTNSRVDCCEPRWEKAVVQGCGAGVPPGTLSPRCHGMSVGSIFLTEAFSSSSLKAPLVSIRLQAVQRSQRDGKYWDALKSTPKI